MKFLKKKFVWAISYAVLLTAFTLYMVMDTFVIARVYTVVPSEADAVFNSNQTNESALTESSEPETQSKIITDNSYIDENISVTITQYREYNTDIYVADVKISSVDYLQTAFADNSYGRNVTAATSETAKNNNAILAINGDFYGAQEKGYVLRNGELYRDSVGSAKDDLVIWKDGSFGIIKEDEVSASDIADKGALQILSFGPAVLIDGSISVSQKEEVVRAQSSNPRTAIGIIDNLHYIFLVSDGRTRQSAGLSLYHLARFMQGLGAITAYNLDGGGSATMYFNGKVINHPTTDGNTFEERHVSDIVYIGY